MSGWFRCPADLWQDVADALPHPWPRGAAVIDIAWWADQVDLGRRDWPSSRSLSRRWGWGHKRVRILLRQIDPQRYAAGHSEGTARAQRGHSEGTARAQHGPGKPAQSTKKGTARAQRGHSEGTARAQRGPHARSIQTQTQTQTQTSTDAHAKHAPRSLHDLPLTARVHTALGASGIETVDALTSMTAAELRTVPRIGAKAAVEIETALKGVGLCLKPPAPSRGQSGRAAAMVWSEEWKADGREAVEDFGRVASRLGGCRPVVADLDRARAAFRAYLEAERLKPGVWPHDEGPSVRKFLLKPEHWLQIGRTASRAAADAGERERRAAAVVELARRRARQRGGLE